MIPTRVAAVASALLLPLVTPGQATASVAPGTTQRIGPLADINGKRFGVGAARLSGDGRWLVIGTTAPLVAGDTNGANDIYVEDLQTGSITRASVTNSGAQPNGHCDSPRISDGGRFVVFRCTATNMLSPDVNGTNPDIFVRDLLLATTTLASVSSTGEQANTFGLTGSPRSENPDISDDGRYVSFVSPADNLVPGEKLGYTDAYVHDMVTGTTTRVSTNADGSEALFNVNVARISGNGRYVAFETIGPLLPSDTNGFKDIYVRDLVTGALDRASVGSDGTEGDEDSYDATISDDGRYVAFGSLATTLVPNDRNGYGDAFVRDRVARATVRLNVASDGTEGNMGTGSPQIGGNGRYVPVNVLSTNLGSSDANGSTDAWVFDLESKTNELQSVSLGGNRTGNAISIAVSISDDGRRMLFVSRATDLVQDGILEPVYFTFIRDRGPPLGIGDLTVDRGDGTTDVSGWARLSSEAIWSVADPPDDAGVTAVSAEISNAELRYRPEDRDLLFTLGLAPAPRVWTPVSTSTIARSFRISFSLGGVVHQVVARGEQGTSTFSLLRCDPDCATIASLGGGIGTAGDDVRVAVPLSVLGADEGDVLAGTAAESMIEAASGVILDTVALPTAMIPVSGVQLGSGTDPDAVNWQSASVAPSSGRFSALIDGTDTVWVRACVGTRCSDPIAG